jgi:hypothetical protein
MSVSGEGEKYHALGLNGRTKKSKCNGEKAHSSTYNWNFWGALPSLE